MYIQPLRSAPFHPLRQRQIHRQLTPKQAAAGFGMVATHRSPHMFLANTPQQAKDGLNGFLDDRPIRIGLANPNGKNTDPKLARFFNRLIELSDPEQLLIVNHHSSMGRLFEALQMHPNFLEDARLVMLGGPEIARMDTTWIPETMRFVSAKRNSTLPAIQAKLTNTLIVPGNGNMRSLDHILSAVEEGTRILVIDTNTPQDEPVNGNALIQHVLADPAYRPDLLVAGVPRRKLPAASLKLTRTAEHPAINKLKLHPVLVLNIADGDPDDVAMNRALQFIDKSP